ncbi:cytochrome c family protein [Rhodocaloribacter litoris]|uniref:multiheme c-type cytochrome n=1 Tax=Rhodocaloribacter litoris TaxID=2558931 RepID=UPI00141F3794|nr:multiheme c-type cytochrome [Rhodocaloribacter litoris]QXD13779.1 cytochrome c family protein [Rhodocaloribacter litoris]
MSHLASLLGLCVFLLAACRTTPDVPPGVVPLSARFDSLAQPYAFALPVLAPVEGVGGVRAGDCGRCHEAHYAEWRGSTHARALHDLQFQAEITKPDAPKWLCLNCHAPAGNQRASLVTGLDGGDVLRPVTRPNPAFDAQMQAEGVTCAACHVRPDPETGRSVIVGAFETDRAPHPVRVDPAALRDVCRRCHDPQGEPLTRNLVCWFETYRELEEGRAALPPPLRSADCVTCHMPATRRRLAVGFDDLPLRTSHRHWWTGGGVPKTFGAYDSLLARGFAPALDVAWAGLDGVDGGDSLRLTLHLTNRAAGHHLPTADPERFLLALVSLHDAGGDTLASTRLRIGQTWAWNPARKLADHRLRQGETRVWTATLPRPPGPPRGRLDVTVLHVRLTTSNARHMMTGAPAVDEALLPGGRRLVAELPAHYPFATYIYAASLDLATGARRVATPEELIARSKAEQGRPLPERVY